MRRRNRIRVAQGLRCDPILAVSAMEIAAEHPKAHCQRARQSVKKRLLLDGVELQCPDVAMRHEQLSASIGPHAANAVESIEDDAAVATCKAAQPTVLELLV